MTLIVQEYVSYSNGYIYYLVCETPKPQHAGNNPCGFGHTELVTLIGSSYYDQIHCILKAIVEHTEQSTCKYIQNYTISVIYVHHSTYSLPTTNELTQMTRDETQVYAFQHLL